MKKNPIVPYAVIAVLGILAMVILSGVGLNQMDEVQDQDDNQEEQGQGNGEGAADVTNPEEIFSQMCASCHGADLSGGAAGPALTGVADRAVLRRN